jgi:hypothetical protein
MEKLLSQKILSILSIQYNKGLLIAVNRLASYIQAVFFLLFHKFAPRWKSIDFDLLTDDSMFINHGKNF